MGAKMWVFNIRIALFSKFDLNDQSMHIKSICSSILSIGAAAGLGQQEWCLIKVDVLKNYVK